MLNVWFSSSQARCRLGWTSSGDGTCSVGQPAAVAGALPRRMACVAARLPTNLAKPATAARAHCPPPAREPYLRPQLRFNKVSELIHNSTNHRNLERACVTVHFQEIIDKVRAARPGPLCARRFNCAVQGAAL